MVFYKDLNLTRQNEYVGELKKDAGEGSTKAVQLLRAIENGERIQVGEYLSVDDWKIIPPK